MAENDAKDLYDLFTNKSYLGAEPDHVRLLLGKPDAKRKSEPATADNILKAVQWLAESSKKDDLAIFAIIGEGAPLRRQGRPALLSGCRFETGRSLQNRGPRRRTGRSFRQDEEPPFLCLRRRQFSRLQERARLHSRSGR